MFAAAVNAVVAGLRESPAAAAALALGQVRGREGGAVAEAARGALDDARPILISQEAAAAAFDLPPPFADASSLHLLACLALLADAAYTATPADVGRTVHLPARGGRRPERATLLAFRAAPPSHEVGDPQQFGVWDAPAGLVVAFRGTATVHDVVVDAACHPLALAMARGAPSPLSLGLRAHAGFLHGARRHADAILATLAAARARRPGGVAPVFLTGHSLGGGYAAALALDLLASARGASLFAGGGGVATFGAPCVLHVGGGRAERAHAALAAAAEAATADCATADSLSPPPFIYVNVVNAADVVPRLLGASFSKVARALDAHAATAALRATVADYRPIGTLLLVVGPGGVRRTGAPLGRLGGAAESDAAAAHLAAGRPWAAAAAAAAATSHHSLDAYRGALAAAAAAAEASSARDAAPLLSADAVAAARGVGAASAVAAAALHARATAVAAEAWRRCALGARGGVGGGAATAVRSPARSPGRGGRRR